MRLSKTIEVVLGLAASGGIVLGLSGNAFADTSGTNTNTQSDVNVVSRQIVTTGSSAGDSSTPAGSGTVKIADTGKDTAPSASTPVNGSANTSDSSKPTAGTPLAGTGTGSDKPAGVVAVGGSGSGSEVAAVAAPVHGDTPVKDAAAVAAAPAATETALPALSAEAAVAIKPIDSVVVNSVVLPIQPRITTARLVVVEDLAAQVPSAPVSHENSGTVPAPSQSSEFFGRLTAVLAGSVVPPVFLTPALGIVGLMPALTLLLIVSYLALRSALNVSGDWIRRGGFAHAARSDVGDSIFSTFATPFVLSYAGGTFANAELLFNGGRQKTVLSMVPNAFRKEEMR